MDVSTNTSAYQNLLVHHRDAQVLASTAMLLAWDQETKMPRADGAAAFRARQMSQLARLNHAKATDPRIDDWLGECEADSHLLADPYSPESVNVREWRRDYDAATKLPESLVSEFSETTAHAKHNWAKAKATNDFAAFAPQLEKVVALNQQRADCWGVPAGGERWDALAQHHERGMNAANVSAVFAPLATELTALLGELLDKGTYPGNRLQGATVPIEKQRTFANIVAQTIGFDFSRGRADESAHPFCMPLHRDDTRLTSRFREHLFLDGLSSTMHEAGHGIYNQNIPGGEHLDTPFGSAMRFAIHESQSRMIENHVGRSRSFWKWCGPIARQHFAELGTIDDEEFFIASNEVQRSLIRTEADELTYNLHILIRFELERALISGDLSVADLPAAWADRYQQYLGVVVPSDTEGCLQDIHWAMGAMGYFPTYTLGNLYAAQLYEAADAATGGLDAHFAKGDFQPLLSWLIENVHGEGKRFDAAQLCQRATGNALSSKPLLRYLREKFSSVYQCA